jgi:pyridoxamine--pyruvate transaminase
MRDPDFTLSSGPTMASPRVLAALGAPIVYHYDPSFLEAFRRTERKVGRLYRTEHDVVLMHGEAALGLEAAARSLVRPGIAVLNLVSGVYGKGMGQWLSAFGAVLHEIEVPYNESIDPGAVEAYLDDHEEIELVSVVHCETPSGTLNPVERIGPIADAHGALTLVDCVSALGGIPIFPDAWKLDVCVAGPQKFLAGPSGMSLISVSDRAWEAIRANPAAPRASYLSMLDWKDQWVDGDSFPFTPSVVDVHGVEAACDELLEEGLEASFARHQDAARACRSGAQAMGLELWPRSEEIAAACVTTIVVPDGLTHTEVRDRCRSRYGVMISGGQGAGNLVGIGHMGPGARSLNPLVGLAALGQSLSDLGARVDIGQGLETALGLIAEPIPMAST